MMEIKKYAVGIFDCIRNHTSVFHYIKRRIIVIHECVRRSSPVGIADVGDVVEVTNRPHRPSNVAAGTGATCVRRK